MNLKLTARIFYLFIALCAILGMVVIAGHALFIVRRSLITLAIAVGAISLTTYWIDKNLFKKGRK